MIELKPTHILHLLALMTLSATIASLVIEENSVLDNIPRMSDGSLFNKNAFMKVALSLFKLSI